MTKTKGNSKLDRFAVIGGGAIGTRHLMNLQKLGVSEIACLHHSKSSVKTAEGIFDLYQWQDLIAWRPSAVIICSPTSLHIDHLLKIGDKSSHILMEKPLSNMASDYPNLQFVNHLFMIGYMLRWHEQLKRIKNILYTHQLGVVTSAYFEFGSYLPNWHPDEDFRRSYASLPYLGGGVINTISHEVDLITWFFGLPHTVYTQRSASNILGIPAEENCDTIFGYSKFNVILHLDYLQKSYRRALRICYTEGTLEWDWVSNEIRILSNGSVERLMEDNKFDLNQLYLNELKSFISLIEQEQFAHDLDYRYAIQNQNILDAMHQSMNNNIVVELKKNVKK